jgi:hypothetical protein
MPSVIKIRAPMLLRVIAIVSLTALAIFNIVIFYAEHRRHPDGLAVFLWVFVAVTAAVTIAAQSWFGINLTETEAVVNNLRRRRLPWCDIAAVTQEPFMGGTRVVLWTIGGDRVPLRSPLVDMTGIGRRRFESDFQVIGRWWTTQHLRR